MGKPLCLRRILPIARRGGLFPSRASQGRRSLYVHCPPAPYVEPPEASVRPDRNPVRINQVIVRTGWLKGILRRVGISGWNAWVEFLFAHNLICPAWAEDEQPPLFDMTFDFSGADFSGMELDGINLRFANLRGALFRRTSLRGAKLDLSDISGTDFSGATLNGATFDMSVYDSSKPPVGLAANYLSQCEAIVRDN